MIVHITRCLLESVVQANALTYFFGCVLCSSSALGLCGRERQESDKEEDEAGVHGDYWSSGTNGNGAMVGWRAQKRTDTEDEEKAWNG